MADTSSAWRVGDTVSLCPNGNESDRVTGIVSAVDEEGLPRGVRVQLDRSVRGADDCYASHDELTLIRRGEP